MKTCVSTLIRVTVCVLRSAQQANLRSRPVCAAGLPQKSFDSVMQPRTDENIRAAKDPGGERVGKDDAEPARSRSIGRAADLPRRCPIPRSGADKRRQWRRELQKQCLHSIALP